LAYAKTFKLSESRHFPLHPTALHRFQNLRSLELDITSQPIIFHGSESLESLTIVDISAEGFREDSSDSVSFPRLHTLRMCGLLDAMIPDWLVHWELPSLKRVTCESGDLYKNEPEELPWVLTVPRSFTVHGKTIRSLDISFVSSRHNISIRALPQSSCLEHLVLHHTLLSGLVMEAHPLTVANLARLDVRMSSIDNWLLLISDLATCMGSLLQSFQPQPELRLIFPSLKELHLVDIAKEETRDKGLDTWEAWNLWLANCTNMGLKVVDCAGEALKFEEPAEC
jgi:hypothetical protein